MCSFGEFWWIFFSRHLPVFFYRYNGVAGRTGWRVDLLHIHCTVAYSGYLQK